jgi:hypothetical protein
MNNRVEGDVAHREAGACAVLWRQGLPEDMARLQELWDEQERRFAGTGVKVDRPDLTQPPTMAVRVAEREGKIVGFYHVEAVAELCLVTGDEEVMKSLAPEMAKLSHWLKANGVRTGWGLAPKKFAAAMERFLRKFPPIRKWQAFEIFGVDFTELGD